MLPPGQVGVWLPWDQQRLLSVEGDEAESMSESVFQICLNKMSCLRMYVDHIAPALCLNMYYPLESDTV